ncbi:MAG TPA: YbjQ family protein [Ktedonobacterales bacterium]|jgi:uncharacterized protein YbjQ (UPF0145 family)
MGQPNPQTAPTQQRGAAFDHGLVTGGLELPNYTITRNFGLVRGIVVRSRGLVGSIGAGLQQIVGGNISLYTEMCERARGEAYEIMIQHAAAIGANGIIAVRYDATEISQGVTEVLCYGTAVYVTPRQTTMQ